MSPGIQRRRGSGRPHAVEAEGQPHLVFRVADEEYAVPLLAVREIVRPETVAPVSEAPPSLRGVLVLRGEPVPVLDLALALGGSSRPDTPETCVLIVETRLGEEAVRVGLAVHGASRVVDLRPAEMAATPRLSALFAVELVVALARVGSGFILILDSQRLLFSEELRAAASAARSGAGPAR